MAVMRVNVAQSAICKGWVCGGAGERREWRMMGRWCLWGSYWPLALLGDYVVMLHGAVGLALRRRDEPAKAVLCLIHLRRGKWLKVVTRDFSLGEPECTAAETAV